MNWFSIAGADKKFLPAEATIDGESVVVRSPSVAAPSPSVSAGTSWLTPIWPTKLACRPRHSEPTPGAMLRRPLRRVTRAPESERPYYSIDSSSAPAPVAGITRSTPPKMITVGMNYHVIQGKQKDFEQKFEAVMGALLRRRGTPAPRFGRT